MYKRARARPAKARLNAMVELCKGIDECKAGEIVDDKSKETTRRR
jgi:hypothetical protein